MGDKSAPVKSFGDMLADQDSLCASCMSPAFAPGPAGGAVLDLGPGILSILDALPFYVMLLDEHHRVLLANRAVRSVIGQEPDEIVGGYCPRIVHGKDEPIAECPLETAVREDRSVCREIHDSGSGQWLESMIFKTGHTLPDGRRVYLHLVRDITDGKKAQEAMRDSQLELEKEVKTLKGLLPICASCKKIRDDKGDWNEIEHYVQEHSRAEFTHGLCPDCTRKLYPEYWEKTKDRRG